MLFALCRSKWVNKCLSFFLGPSWSSSSPLYPWSVTSQGACLDSLLFHYFHFKLTCESIKELGSTSPLTFGSHFYLPISALLFQTFSLGIFFFSSTRKKKRKKKKTINQKKKMQRREGAFLQAPTLPFHFWLPFLPSHFWPFVLNVFSWHLFLFK